MPDILEDEPRQKPEKTKGARFSKLRMFFRNNKWKILAAVLFMAFLLYISSLSDVAYSASMQVESTQIHVQNHPCYGYIVYGHIDIAFNPLIYPITHLVGRGRVTGTFARWSGSTYPSPQDPNYASSVVKESLIIEAVSTEIVRNLVYTGSVSAVAAFGLGKLFENLRAQLKKPKSDVQRGQ